MRTGFLIILSTVVLVLPSPLSWAQWRGQRGMGRERGRPPCWRPEDLRLTPEQTEKLKSIQARYLRDITALRNDLANKRYELRRLMSNPTASARDMTKRREEAFALENRIQEKVDDYQLKVREILTPRQFELWISRDQAGFGPRRGSRRGMGMRYR